MTCGLAVLSLEGRPLLVDSYRSPSRLDLIATIAAQGDPVIVATDVQAPPEFAENLAVKFEAVLFTFPTQLPASAKHKLVEEYAASQKLKLKDSHQKDALAAALKAFNHFKNKFAQAEAHIREGGARVPLEEVYSLIVKGFTIAEAAELLKMGEACRVEAEGRPREVPRPEVNNPLRLLASLKNRVQEQSLTIARLHRLSEKRLQEVMEARLRIDILRSRLAAFRLKETLEIKREQEYGRLTSEIQHLKRRISELEEKLAEARPLVPERLKEMEQRGEIVILKMLPAFSQDAIEEVSKRTGINPGEVLLLEDASGGGSSTAKLLIEKGIKAVVASSNLSHMALEEFLKADLPVINRESLEILWLGAAPYVKAGDLRRAIESFRAEQRLQQAGRLEKLLDQYKVEKPA